MKLFICILLLSALCGFQAFILKYDTDDNVDEHRDYIIDLLNVSSYHLIEIDDELDAKEDLVRVHSAAIKIYKKGCERDLALASTLGGGAGGAGIGAAAGAAAGSVVPVVGTAIGALLGAVIGFFGGTAVGIGTTISTRDPTCAEPLSNYLLNADLKIIGDDIDKVILKHIRMWNQNLDMRGLVVRDKTDISARIVATEPSAYKTDSSVTVSYLIARNLHNTTKLFETWNYNFISFLKETKRQMDQDVPEFPPAIERTWRGDKRLKILDYLLQLQQNIEINLNNYHIKQLYHRVQSLENDLKKLRDLVEAFQKKASCANKSKKIDGVAGGVEFFGKVAKLFPEVSFAAASVEAVPFVGGIVKGASVLISAYCYISQNYLE